MSGLARLDDLPIVGTCSECEKQGKHAPQFETRSGPVCQAGHGGAPSSGQWKFDPKQKTDMKKAKAEVEASLDDAQVVAERARLEIDLLETERAGYELVEEDVGGARSGLTDEEKKAVVMNPSALAALVERRAASARRDYSDTFQVDTRSKAAWAARKIAEAKTREEEVKAHMRAAVARATRVRESREEILGAKLEEWAKKQPRETAKCRACKGTGAIRSAPVMLSVDGGAHAAEAVRESPCEKCRGFGKHVVRVVDRFPEDGVRVELRPKTEGGPRVVDSAAALRAVIDEFGLMEAMDLGLIEQRPVLRESALVEFVRGNNKFLPAGVVVEEERETEKVTVVRLSRED